MLVIVPTSTNNDQNILDPIRMTFSCPFAAGMTIGRSVVKIASVATEYKKSNLALAALTNARFDKPKESASGTIRREVT